jgi:hypothetical protein
MRSVGRSLRTGVGVVTTLSTKSSSDSLKSGSMSQCGSSYWARTVRNDFDFKTKARHDFGYVEPS